LLADGVVRAYEALIAFGDGGAHAALIALLALCASKIYDAVRALLADGVVRA
jgi:hypothetical protein